MSNTTRLLSAAGLALLFAGGAAARAAAPVDLSDLRDAVRAAAKQGGNVDEVRRAVDAVEKLVAKGWTAPKPGDDPPAELTALRGAVEAAARKGENVDGIRTELDAAEKALLGRNLTAAKPDLPPLGAPKPDPEPGRGFGRDGRGGFRGGVVVGGGGRVVIGGADGAVRSVTIANDSFTIRATQGGVKYVLSGSLVGEDPDAVKVVITDGDKTVEAESLKKVPEAYREGVDKLLKSIRR